MTMKLEDGFKMLASPGLLDPEPKKRMYFWYGFEQALLIDRSKPTAPDITKALGGNRPKSPSCYGRIGRYLGKEGKPELRLVVSGAVPGKLVKDMKHAAKEHGRMPAIEVVIDEGPYEEEEDGAPAVKAPDDRGAVLLKQLTELMPEFKKAQLSPVAGPKLVELLQKAKKHLDAGDFEKASTDIANLTTLIPLALKHATAKADPQTAQEQPKPPGGEARKPDAPQPARDEPALKKRLAAIMEKLKAAREAQTGYQPEIERLAKLVGESGKTGKFEEGHQALDELERLVDTVTVEVAQHQEFASEVRKQKNSARAKRLGEALEGVKSEKYFPQGMSAQYAKEGLKAGKEFQLFLFALKNFEDKYAFWRSVHQKNEKTASPVDQTPFLHDLDEMIGVAQSYLAHYDKDLSDDQKKQKESQRKRQICATTLKALQQSRIKAEFEDLGDPKDWDLKKEHQAAAMYAKVLFEEGDAPASKLPSGVSGVSGAWWVEAIDFADANPKQAKKKKKFIFKPSDAEETIPGFPKGGSAPREVVSKVAVDRIQASTGIDFGFPETTLVSIDDGKLPDEAEEEGGKRPAQRMGSMQHFNKSGKPLAALRDNDPALLGKIPKEEVQKAAIMDLVTLNLDRHSGNFLVDSGGDEKAAPRLIPIDHGLTLPSREGLDARRHRLHGPHGNALMAMPGSKEKFTPEMQKKIQSIDANAVVEDMKKSLATLKSLHPDEKLDEKLPEANFELTRRSIQFMQAAAKELAVDELFDAYAANAEEIFDSPKDKQKEGFDKAIAAAKDRSASRRELNAIFEKKKDKDKLKATVEGLGWAVNIAFNDSNFERWCAMNPKRVMNIYKYKLENPPVRIELDDILGKLGNPPELVAKVRRQTLRKGHETASIEMKKMGKAASSATKPAPVPAVSSAELGKTMQEIEKEFPGSVPKDAKEQAAMAAQWKEYQSLGGFNAFCRLGGNAETAKLQFRLEDLKDLKAEEAALKEIDTLDPADHEQNLEGALAIRLDVVFEGMARIKDQKTLSPINVLYSDAMGCLDGHPPKFQECEQSLVKAEKLLDSELDKLDALGRKFAARHELVLDRINSLPVSSDAHKSLRLRYKDSLRLADAESFDECEPVLKRLEADAERALKAEATV